MTNTTNETRINFIKKYKWPIVSAVVVIIAAAAVLCVISCRGEAKFRDAVDRGDFLSAGEYVSGLESLEDKAKAESYVIAAMDKQFEKYTAGEISQNEAKSYVEAAYEVFGYPELEGYLSISEALHTSEEAFGLGEQYESEGRLADAIRAYSSVGAADPKYGEAQARAIDLKEDFRVYVNKNVSLWEASGDWQNGVTEVSVAEEFFPGEYTGYLATFTTMKYNAEKDMAQASQQLCVYDEGLLNVSGGVLVITPVRNLTEKVITEYTVAFCAYNDGKRTDIASASEPEDKVTYIECKNNNAQVGPLGETGSDFGWKISADTAKNINKIHACVVEASFTDGTKWENPYFDYWCREHEIVTEER